MFTAALSLTALLVCIECTHIFSIDKDFSKLSSDKELAKHFQVQAVLARLKTFKLAVHPRIRLFYQLLKRAIAAHARGASDSLYNPSIYKRVADNIV